MSPENTHMLMGFYMEALLQYMVSALKLFLTGYIEYRVMHIDIVMIEKFIRVT